MDRKEIEDILGIKISSVNNSGENKVFIPNEIFKDLISCNELIKGGTSHLAFAYSYVYINYWLYRYCKYQENEKKITQSMIKEILGYSQTNKTLDYIIKKGGATDKIGYTESTTDYPLRWWVVDNEFIEFETINNFKSNNIGIRAISRDRNYKVKFPIKGFHRTPESMSERLLDGTFYEIENTHQIPIEVFIYCMEHKDIGTIGFYLYGYLKYLNDLFKEGAVVSLGRFIKELGIKSSSLDTYLQKLKEHNMITCHEQPFVFGIPERLKKPNTYLVNSYQDFHIKNSPIKIRKVMHVSTDKKIRSSLYEEEVNVREKDDSETVIDFDLPF